MIHVGVTVAFYDYDTGLESVAYLTTLPRYRGTVSGTPRIFTPGLDNAVFRSALDDALFGSIADTTMVLRLRGTREELAAWTDRVTSGRAVEVRRLYSEGDSWASAEVLYSGIGAGLPTFEPAQVQMDFQRAPAALSRAVNLLRLRGTGYAPILEGGSASIEDPGAVYQFSTASFEVDALVNAMGGTANCGCILARKVAPGAGAGAGPGWALWIDSATGQIKFEIVNAALTRALITGPVVTLDQALRIRAVRDYAASRLRLYVDGVEVATAVSTAAVGSIAAPLVTTLSYGAFSGAVRPQYGTIQEVAVWSVVRADEQADSDEVAPLLGTETGLLSLWPCNDAAGTALADATPAARSLTLTGTYTWAPSGEGGPDSRGYVVPRVVGTVEHVPLEPVAADPIYRHEGPTLTSNVTYAGGVAQAAGTARSNLRDFLKTAPAGSTVDTYSGWLRLGATPSFPVTISGSVPASGSSVAARLAESVLLEGGLSGLTGASTLATSRPYVAGKVVGEDESYESMAKSFLVDSNGAVRFDRTGSPAMFEVTGPKNTPIVTVSEGYPGQPGIRCVGPGWRILPQKQPVSAATFSERGPETTLDETEIGASIIGTSTWSRLLRGGRRAYYQNRPSRRIFMQAREPSGVVRTTIAGYEDLRQVTRAKMVLFGGRQQRLQVQLQEKETLLPYLYIGAEWLIYINGANLDAGEHFILISYTLGSNDGLVEALFWRPMDA